MTQRGEPYLSDGVVSLHGTPAGFIIIDERTGKAVGSISAWDDMDDGDAEVSIYLRPEVRGKGLGRHIAQLAHEHLLTNPWPKRLIGRVEPDNEASLRTARHAGFLSSEEGEDGRIKVIRNVPIPERPPSPYAR